MGYTRHQVAAALEDGIQADEEITVAYKVIPDPREIPDDPSIDCYLQLVRQRVVPAERAPRGQYAETFELWVIVAHIIDDELVEDVLDDRLAEVLELVRLIDVLTFKSAERRVHRSQRQAYLVSVEAASSTTE